MAFYRPDVVIQKCTLAASADTTSAFMAPRRAIAATVICPDIDSVATWKLQMLQLSTADGQATEVWHDVYLFDATDGTDVQIGGLADNRARTFQPWIGSGVYRLVMNTALNNALRTIEILFHY